MINRKYLPSKKFLMALYIAIAFILIAIIFNYLEPIVIKYLVSHPIADTTGVTVVVNIDLDSDNDGLVDWKENLYGTNPKLADTDGDGTNDVEEIALNRDPLKANTAPKGQEPNDKIDPAKIEESQRAIEEYQSLNATEKMSRDLMSDIFANQQISGAMDQQTIDSIVQKSIQDMPVKEYSGITKESDLNLIDVNEKTFNKDLAVYTKSYYNETESYRKVAGKDLNIINNYISTGNDVRTDMKQITLKYQTIINNLIEAPLPSLPDSSGTIAHLTLINDLEKLIQVDNDIINTNIKDMATIFSDLSVYNSTTKELLLALQVMDSMLKINR